MNFLRLFEGLDFSHWGIWTIAVVGLGAAALPLVMGRLFVRRAAEADPETDDVFKPQYDPFVHGSSSEQRKAARRAGGLVEVLISDEQAKASPWRGWVQNRSMGGLCLSVDRSIAPGTILTVRAVQSPPVAPWLEVQVRSCRETKVGWELGCQFVRTPPTGLLLLFG